MNEIRGKIHAISGLAVVAKDMAGVMLHTIAYVGKDGLLGEVIRIEDGFATIQVYEDTVGLSIGEEVVSFCSPLKVMLGPGLLSNLFDGIQRPLLNAAKKSGEFMGKGIKAAALDMDRVWDFQPEKKVGDSISEGDIIGIVRENESIVHRILAPPGTAGVIKDIRKGGVCAREDVARLEGGLGIKMYHEWPVRKPRPFKRKIPPESPFITGQRVFDILLPLAEGGVAVMPGGFGTGKTVTEQTIAKFSKVDIVVYIGCGERGNEMTDVLTEFENLKDASTGRALNLRTVVIVNTSNMPVAAREASIFIGVTIAEYFRDMGYSVAVMADSISRWAEALREISSRLEEMPGEEGFPPYLAHRLGGFYERSGKVETLGSPERTGSVTIISAVSPPGGDFSEPVTQSSMRFAGCLWALDTQLAYRRHFPAIDWKGSYTLYFEQLKEWFKKNVAHDMGELRKKLLILLQRADELKEVKEVIGLEGMQDEDRLTLEGAAITEDIFLRQSVFNEKDSFSTYSKQYLMLKAIFVFMDCSMDALKKGVYLEEILGNPLRTELLGLNDVGNEEFSVHADKLIRKIEGAFIK